VAARPGTLPPLRGIYDNANERASHFSNFPAQRVIHEAPALPPPPPPAAPVQQWFMNPPMMQTPIKAEGVTELGAAHPNPNFYEPKREHETRAMPQVPGLGAARPHSPEGFKVSTNETFERRDYGLRRDPKKTEPFTPSAYK
jgi:hypothetical protein